MRRLMTVLLIMALATVPAFGQFKDVTIVTFSEFQRCLEGTEDFTDEQLASISACFESVFTVPVDPPPTEPPIEGFADCGDNVSAEGTGSWAEWCVDEQRNFLSPGGGVMGMESNAQATRSRLPGTGGRGVAPPTVGSNRVVMTCELKFNQGWLDGISLGGQHLFVFGEGPFRLPGGGTSDDHIRFDFGCFNVTNADGSSGNGFKDGFRVLVYSQKDDVRQEVWFPSDTKMPGVFKAGVWTQVKADGKYDPGTGRCTLALTIGNQTKTVSTTCKSGIVPKLGDSIGWGNVDSRPNTVEIRNLRYATQ